MDRLAVDGRHLAFFKVVPTRLVLHFHDGSVERQDQWLGYEMDKSSTSLQVMHTRFVDEVSEATNDISEVFRVSPGTDEVGNQNLSYKLLCEWAQYVRAVVAECHKAGRRWGQGQLCV